MASTSSVAVQCDMDIPDHPVLHEIRYIDFFDNMQLWTLVTHINSALCFYVQPFRYKQYVNLVSRPGAKLPPEDFTLLKIVVYKDVNIDMFVRGKIIFINGLKCDLFAIDFGFILKSVPLEDLYKRLYEVPVVPLAIHCQLANCNFLESQDNNLAAQTIFECLESKLALISIAGIMHGKYMVRVLNKNMHDVVEMMILMGHLELAFSFNQINPHTCRQSAEHYLHHKAYIAGTKLQVKLISGESLEMFYVTDLKDIENNNLYISEINNRELDDLEESQLKKDFPVSVFSRKSNSYTRGFIKKVNREQQTAEVHLVDEGRIEKVQWEALKEVPIDLFSIQAMVIKCTVIEKQLFDYHCQKYLKPGKTFYITIIQPSTSEDNPNIVLLSDI